MYDLVLVLPEQESRNSAENFRQEFFDNKEKIINGSALLDNMTYDEWLENTINNRNSETARKDWVAETTFFAKRKDDNRIVGIISVRHNLKNPFLTEYGGHMGYSVRPSERRKGYATEMLKCALKFAKSLEILKVMIACYSDNIGSVRTIEKCGGRLTQVKPYTDGKPVNIYWIDNSI